MNNLKVRNWQDWEEICKYLIQHKVKEKLDADVQYVNYGFQGQKQHGIDLIPSPPSSLSVVVQCKHIEGCLTWNTVEAEMKKTDGYPNSIKHYCILTTGNRHTSVQNILNNHGYTYTRPNGEQYKLHILYWDDFNPQEIIPSNELSSFFPSVFTTQNQKTQNISTSDYLAAVSALKEFIPKVITAKNLIWLENWDFSCGYVVESDYSPFVDLYFEHNRTVLGLNGSYEFLHTGDRIELARTLPAGERFFNALGEFHKSIYGEIIGVGWGDGRILSIKDLSESSQQRIIFRWQSSAASLAQVYRYDVLGESQQ